MDLVDDPKQYKSTQPTWKKEQVPTPRNVGIQASRQEIAEAEREVLAALAQGKLTTYEIWEACRERQVLAFLTIDKVLYNLPDWSDEEPTLKQEMWKTMVRTRGWQQGMELRVGWYSWEQLEVWLKLWHDAPKKFSAPPGWPWWPA